MESVAKETDPRLVCIRDVPYRSSGTSPRAVLDIYYDQGVVRRSVASRPVLFCVHGGFWCWGDKGGAQEMAVHLAQRGYCVVAPSYTLSRLSKAAKYVLKGVLVYSFLTALFAIATAPYTGGSHVYVSLVVLVWVVYFLLLVRDSMTSAGDIHPCHVEDLAAALLWTQQHIHQHHGDASCVSLLGYSAGGHLVALLANSPLLQVGLTSPIRAVICISGVFSHVWFQELWGAAFILDNVFGEGADLREAFPYHKVTERTPPHLLICAERDFSLKRHAYDYSRALQEAGVCVQYQTYDNNNHLSIRKYWACENQLVLRDICTFLDLHVHATSTPNK